MKKTATDMLEKAYIYEKLTEDIALLEHEIYKSIPGTKSSYRQDSANLNTSTLKHSHVYAKPNGRGKEIYAVNLDGSGHDGSSETGIPSKHADYFRSLGYSIPTNNILEQLDFNDINHPAYSLIIIENA